MPEIGFVIERKSKQTGQPEYLIANVAYYDSPQNCTGCFQWSSQVCEAIRFARSQDAIAVIGVMRTMATKMMYGDTISGLRQGDPAPIVAEHIWCDPFPLTERHAAEAV